MRNFSLIRTAMKSSCIEVNKKLTCDFHKWTLHQSNTVHNFTLCFSLRAIFIMCLHLLLGLPDFHSVWSFLIEKKMYAFLVSFSDALTCLEEYELRTSSQWHFLLVAVTVPVSHTKTWMFHKQVSPPSHPSYKVTLSVCCHAVLLTSRSKLP